MRNRSGISFIEFLGCLVALAGGVTIGASYLGVDLKQVAYGALERTSVDLAVFGLAPAKTAGEEAVTPSIVPSARSKDSQSAGQDHQAWPAPKKSNPAAIEAVASSPAPAQVDDSAEMTAEQRQAATLAYWKGIGECIQREINGRSSSIQDRRWQLLDYLTQRQKGHQQAVEALQGLENRGVDAVVLAHAQIVLAWHEAGEKLFTQAVDLLTNGPRAVMTGPFAQSWQSAATQHRMEEKLVRNKHRVVLGYLDHTYEALAPFSGAFPD